jgi:hypothetical protein
MNIEFRLYKYFSFIQIIVPLESSKVKITDGRNRTGKGRRSDLMNIFSGYSTGDCSWESMPKLAFLI